MPTRLYARNPLGRRLILAGALTVWSGLAVAQAVADSYPEARELGRRDETDPQTIEYHRDVLVPEFGARYRTWLRECQAQLPEPDNTPYSFVAAIGPDGRVVRLWSDRSAPVFSCLRGHLLFERFTPPPRAPFYLYLHVRFHQ